MSRLHCLVFESDAVAASVLSAIIASEGWSVAVAATLQEARRLVAMQAPDLVFADLDATKGAAWTFIQDPDLNRDASVAVTTSDPDAESAIAALRHGALDYLVKPVESAMVRALLARVAQRLQTRTLGAQHQGGEHGGQPNRFIGRSEALMHLLHQIRHVAPTAVNVMLFGESGTGKEVAARTIHELSGRAKGPFLAVNCGAVSPTLMESEFFGHERGSFTGAERLRLGYFEQAQGGTLFLDEVTEMPVELQVKLLRVLESGTFMRVGSSREQHSDVRIVSATNRRAADALTGGKIRRDLLYRLNVFPVHLPPLRVRGDDVLLIAESFLNELNTQGRTHVRFSDAARTALMAHAWPGNVRELRNAVQRSYVMADGVSIRSIALDDELAAVDAAGSSAASGEVVTLPVGASIAEAEKTLIEATLKRVGGQKEKAAAVLGISLKTLYNRLRVYGLGRGGRAPTRGKRNCQ